VIVVIRGCWGSVGVSYSRYSTPTQSNVHMRGFLSYE
jgi:cytochrome b